VSDRNNFKLGTNFASWGPLRPHYRPGRVASLPPGTRPSSCNDPHGLIIKLEELLLSDVATPVSTSCPTRMASSHCAPAAVYRSRYRQNESRVRVAESGHPAPFPGSSVLGPLQPGSAELRRLCGAARNLNHRDLDGCEHCKDWSIARPWPLRPEAQAGVRACQWLSRGQILFQVCHGVGLVTVGRPGVTVAARHWHQPFWFRYLITTFVGNRLQMFCLQNGPTSPSE
jgi:hypothetical protein